MRADPVSENEKRTYEFWISGFARPIIGQIMGIDTVPVTDDVDTLQIRVYDGSKMVTIMGSAIQAWAEIGYPEAA